MIRAQPSFYGLPESASCLHSPIGTRASDSDHRREGVEAFQRSRADVRIIRSSLESGNLRRGQRRLAEDKALRKWAIEECDFSPSDRKEAGRLRRRRDELHEVPHPLQSTELEGFDDLETSLRPVPPALFTRGGGRVQHDWARQIQELELRTDPYCRKVGKQRRRRRAPAGAPTPCVHSDDALTADPVIHSDGHEVKTGVHLEQCADRYKKTRLDNLHVGIDLDEDVVVVPSLVESTVEMPVSLIEGMMPDQDRPQLHLRLSFESLENARQSRLPDVKDARKRPDRAHDRLLT